MSAPFLFQDLVKTVHSADEAAQQVILASKCEDPSFAPGIHTVEGPEPTPASCSLISTLTL